MIEFRMPSLGADMEAGTLREWLVKPGDIVKRGDIIAVVDTQKGLIDIEVFDEGKIEQLLVQEDEKVPVGTLLALINSGKEAPQKEVTKEEVKREEAKVTVVPAEALQTAAPAISAEAHISIKASPLARRLAREKGIDLYTIRGTGEEGAITREDVERVAGEKVAPGKGKTVAATESIRMAIAAAMSRSNREIPHYYLETRIDMSRALAWLADANRQRPAKQRLLPASLLIRCVAKALTEVPELNGYWEDGLRTQQQINIGFAISLRTGGVLIPAIHDADKKSVSQIMDWFNDIIPRARALNLRSSDLTDATFTITSLGEGNVQSVYGVIYPPQVALAGFGSICEQPWAEKGMVGTRPVLVATLAADHRATDALTGSRFLNAVNAHLQNPAAYE